MSAPHIFDWIYPMRRPVALGDVNAFYASCEAVFNPSIKNKGIVIGSNNDGCIIAANKIAKSTPGFEMWGALHLMWDFIRQHDFVFLSSNYPLYADMSRRVMNILSTFTHLIEVYSIDEAFLDLTGFSDLKKYVLNIRQTVWHNLDLPMSFGVGATKSLAKVAQKIAKKFPKETENVHVIDTAEKHEKALRWLKVEDIWGIGRKITEKLNSINVYTAWDFIQIPEDWIRDELTVVGARIHKELKGVPCLKVEELYPPKKMIGTAKSFGKLQKDFNLIREAVSYYVSEVSERLRQQGSAANVITIGLETNLFRKDLKQTINYTTLCLPIATSDTSTILNVAFEGLKRVYKNGYEYKRASILLSGLVPGNQVNGSLFFTPQPKSAALMKTVDKLNVRYGKLHVRSASCGYNRDKWKLRQLKVSPHYTTRWDEIMKV